MAASIFLKILFVVVQVIFIVSGHKSLLTNRPRLVLTITLTQTDLYTWSCVLMVAAQPGRVCLIPVAYGSSTAWSCVLDPSILW